MRSELGGESTNRKSIKVNIVERSSGRGNKDKSRNVLEVYEVKHLLNCAKMFQGV